ncbi:MAG: hypothetical protein JXB88_01370 [Spirochaetales bacterium]|nr:hypothetical protein [Spirochaetales bacterium]
MNLKKIGILILQVILIMAILFIARMLAGILIPIPGLQMPEEEELRILPFFLLIVALLDALIISYIVRRSTWYGWKLAAALFVLLIGNQIFETQIDGIFFMDYLGYNLFTIALMSLQTFLSSGIGAILAVIILGKMKTPEKPGIKVVFDLSTGRWIIQWIYMPFLFIVLYFLCGALIAWINPAVREYYEGGAGINVLFQALLQIPRGLGWYAMALLVARILRGNKIENAVCTGILFGMLHANVLLLPTAYMPYAVRMTHMIEIFISLFLFGFFAGFFIKIKRINPYEK